MDAILLFLIKKGAHRLPLRMGTAEIGNATGMSQQNASRRLLLLEKTGLVGRSRAEGVAVTERGAARAREFSDSLRAALEGGRLRLRGEVASGLGSGRKFLSMREYRERIYARLGFEPFPGTLNIRLGGGGRVKRRELLALEPLIIEGFSEGGKRYGDIYAYRCEVGGRRAAIVFPLMTRHGMDTIEVIAPECLRKALGLKDGSEVTVTL